MDKKIEHLMDAKNTEVMSDCCSASIYNLNDGCGLCADCKEWCGVAEEE